MHMADNVSEWTADADEGGGFRHVCGLSSLHSTLQNQGRWLVAKDAGTEWIGFRVCTSAAPAPSEGGP